MFSTLNRLLIFIGRVCTTAMQYQGPESSCHSQSCNTFSENLCMPFNQWWYTNDEWISNQFILEKLKGDLLTQYVKGKYLSPNAKNSINDLKKANMRNIV